MKKKLLSVISIVMVLLTVMSTFAVIQASALTVTIDDAPVFKSISATCTSVTINWEEHDDIELQFLVYRSFTGKAGTWKKLATTKAGATSYTDKTVAPNTTYVYTVKAYYKGADGTTYLSDMSGKHTVKTVLAKPVFTLCGNGGKGVVMKWDARSDASGFIIYKSTTGKAGSWSRIKVVNSNKAGTLTDTKVDIGKTYYYCIKATKTIGDKLYASASSKAYKMVIMDVAVPKNLKVAASEEGVRFTFDKVLGTAGYLIYRSETGKAGSWTKIATTKSNNTTGYVDTTAEEGKVYYYTAKSYKTVNGKTTYSNSAKAVSVINLVTLPEIKFEPAEITFNDYYEEISVKLSATGMDEDDEIKIFIDNTEITELLLNNEEAYEKFLKKAKFLYTVDEKKSTDDTLVLVIFRIAPGTGTLRVEHADYKDVYAELKVNCPELDFDKDVETIVLNAEAGFEAIANAIDLLEEAANATSGKDAIISRAKIQLTGAKSSLENAKLLLAKYEKEYSKYDSYKTDVKAVEDSLKAVNNALEDISGDTVAESNIRDAIRELDDLVDDLVTEI